MFNDFIQMARSYPENRSKTTCFRLLLDLSYVESAVSIRRARHLNPNDPYVNPLRSSNKN